MDFATFKFETVNVKQELVDRLKMGLDSLGYTGKLTINVIKADPQSPTEVPCIGINRVDDSETSQSIADGQGSLYDPVTKVNKTFYGTFFAEAQEIRIWHTNADERERLYLAVKALLFGMRVDLSEKGLINFSLRSGKDEQDISMTQAPMAIYWSSITMSYLNPLDVEFSEVVEAITAVPDNGKMYGW